MMSNFFFTLVACGIGASLPLLSHAQGSELARDRNSNFNNGYALPPSEANTLQGSPYLLPAWSAGTVQLNAAEKSIATPLKYDVYRQELRVRRPQGDSVIVPLMKVREFNLSANDPAQRFLCYRAATLPADVGGGCGQALYDGPHAQLLKFVRKEAVRKTVENGGYVSNNTTMVLDEQTRYYLRWPGDGHFTPLKLKRASLEQALAGQPAALAALKARKGSLSSEADLAAAVAAVDPVLTTPTK